MTDLNLAKEVLKTFGGNVNIVFEAISYTNSEFPQETFVDSDRYVSPCVTHGWAITVQGMRGRFVPADDEAQARRVIELLDEIEGRGTVESHDAIVKACTLQRVHEWERVSRCLNCGYITKE